MQPVHPIPPHWPHLAVSPDGQLVTTEVVVIGADEVLEEVVELMIVGPAVVELDLEVETGTDAEVAEDEVTAHPVTVLHWRGRLRELLPT